MSEQRPGIVFRVAGEQQVSRSGGAPLALDAGLPFSVTHSVRVNASRAAGEWQRVEAVPGRDAVLIHIKDGPTLVLAPENARDLMLVQECAENSGLRSAGPDVSGGARGAAQAGEVTVPAALSWPGVAAESTSRSVFGDVAKAVISHIEVVKDLVQDKVLSLVDPAEWTAERIAALVDPENDGVFRLATGKLQLAAQTTRIEPEGTAPVLVFIHGTFSSVVGTFTKFWDSHPTLVERLFESYKGQVFGLEHATLGKSPIENAWSLAQAASPGTVFHLVTHSRGGLVGEVLARVCADPILSDADLDKYFVGDVPNAGRARQLIVLKDLAKTVREKSLRVARVVRVACPARGTLLASKRLDAYVSVLRWALLKAGAAVGAGIVSFLGAVAKKRFEPEVLPGLEAMVPDSPFIRWLHSAEQQIPGDLRVIAGDVRAQSVMGWVKTLIADSLFQGDNDLVVHTGSMYGGLPRAQAASFLLDAGAVVSHFNYFTNERTAQAVVNGLLIDDSNALSKAGYAVIGPLSYAGQDSSGTRAALNVGVPEPTRPAVFVLPGILGSHLRVADGRVWLSYRLMGGISRLRYPTDGVQPDGLLGVGYERLVDFLRQSHEVVPFAFDWRKPIEEEARRLGKAISDALDVRVSSGTPVRIVAHSMGGLLARVMQLECPDVWQRMLQHDSSRVLMLGTPNAGSWAPMQVLSGDDAFGDLLVAVGAPFKMQETRQLFAEMPGFIQLQAELLDRDLGLGSSKKWQELAEQDVERVRQRSWWHQLALKLDYYRWGVPPQGVLDQAVKLRERLNRQWAALPDAEIRKVLLVSGVSRLTPDGYRLEQDGLTYRNLLQGGDGRVPLHSAQLPGVQTYHLAAGHSELSNTRDAFPAFLELLESGRTNQLEPVPFGGNAPSLSRGSGGAGADIVWTRPARRPGAVQGGVEISSVLASANANVAPRDSVFTPLAVTVQNGNLKFVGQPLLIGHYLSNKLTGAEAIVDKLIGGTMSSVLRLGGYPQTQNAFRIFCNTCRPSDNPFSLPRPKAVVVVGLGQEGQLRANDLVATIAAGAIGWAQSVRDVSDPRDGIELAATLIGSGGVGHTAGTSARAIVQGVCAANAHLSAENERLDEMAHADPTHADTPRWPLVKKLVLIELYQERAAEAWRTLLLEDNVGKTFSLSPQITISVGQLMRPIESAYRGVDYDLVSVTTGVETRETSNGDAGATTTSVVANAATLCFKVDSRRARAEVSAQATQTRLVQRLIAAASSEINRDPQVGATLFQLLVPLEIEPHLGGSNSILLELDESTAVIPWEVLLRSSQETDEAPWAIRSQLIRKLRVQDYRHDVRDSRPEDAALVVGGPSTEPSNYAPLPGAVREAESVAAIFSREIPGRVTSLTKGEEALAVVKALFARNYRVIHVSGHGAPGPDGGVVLSDLTFLGPREIKKMRVVPELVFVNCCHLAAHDATSFAAPKLIYPQFAASVADALIQIGVRCVVAAGWAVNDQFAEEFAAAFYRKLLAGGTFREAVTTARIAARDAAHNSQDNTWAAYQCYGDPDWRWVKEAVSSDGARPSLTASVSSAAPDLALPIGLKLALAELNALLQFDDMPVDVYLSRVRALESRYRKVWGDQGDVAESFAQAFASARQLDAAIAWYETAMRDPKGRASQKVVEQYVNLKVRNAFHVADAAAPDKREEARAWAKAEISTALETLEHLIKLQPTEERCSLRGSAYKRLALLEANAESAEARATVARMIASYSDAHALATPAQAFYPALNRLAGELVLNVSNAAWQGLAPSDVELVRQSAELAVMDAPDFWGHAALIELTQYEALSQRRLSAELDGLLRRYKDLHSRVSNPLQWASVYDTARFVLSQPALQAAEAEAIATLSAVLATYAV